MNRMFVLFFPALGDQQYSRLCLKNHKTSETIFLLIHTPKIKDKMHGGRTGYVLSRKQQQQNNKKTTTK